MKKGIVPTERRNALKQGAVLMGMAVSGTVLPALVAGCENDTVKNSDKGYEFDVASVAVLAVHGGAVMKTLGDNNNGKPVIIIRSGENTFVVLSSVCTHQGCLVNLPTAPGGNIVCACHNSHYSSEDGSVLSGPAPSSLKQFPATFDAKNNILAIKF